MGGKRLKDWSESIQNNEAQISANEHMNDVVDLS